MFVVDSKQYYKKQTGRRILGFLLFFVIAFVVVYFLVMIPRVNDGTDAPDTLVKVPLIFFGVLAAIGLIVWLLSLLAFKNKTCCVIAMLIGWSFSGPFVFWLFHPALRFGDGLEPGEKRYREKRERRKREKVEKDFVLIDTIKAYQNAWMKQNLGKRVGGPLKVIFGVGAAVGAIIAIYTYLPKFFPWFVAILALLIWYALVSMLGGVNDVTIKKTEYNVSVGTGWLDYGEVYVNEGKSTYKDETQINWFLGIICVPLVLVAAVVIVIVAAFAVIMAVINLIFPAKGKRAIYLHKKTAIDYDYIPGPDWFKKPMFLINKLFYHLMGINFVNEDFWWDGIGPNYIYKYLSRTNKKYLEHQLEKVDQKHGWHYEL